MPRQYIRIPISERFWPKVDKTDTCWLWTGAKNDKGYGQIRSPGRIDFAHRLSWTLERGDIPPGLSVCHHCDTPLCVNPDHLFLGTQQDNSRDMGQKGRAGATRHPEIVRGERNGRSRLTTAQVVEIRARAQYETRLALANEYRVALGTIYAILARKTWAYA